MAITHPTATRNALADLIDDRVNQGSGAGKLKILTSGDSVLATLTMSDPAFDAASGGTITASSITGANASGTGTAAKFTVTDSDDTIIFTGSVTESGGGGDCIITNTDINAGDPISVSALTYSASS